MEDKKLESKKSEKASPQMIAKMEEAEFKAMQGKIALKKMKQEFAESKSKKEDEIKIAKLEKQLDPKPNNIIT